MALSRYLATTVVVLSCLPMTGCMSWRAPWEEAGAPVPRPSETPDVSFEAARELTSVATDAESLIKAIDAYEAVLAADPAQVAALTAVADHSILLATAYTEDRSAKRELYRRARTLSELAMYTNQDFTALVDQGQRPWEACEVLGPAEMQAMLTWMTALLYEFKECMGTFARVVNIRWIKHLDPFLQRMEEVEPEYESGVIPFNWGFYYFVLPGGMGGDRDRAAEEFARAVEMGSDRLVYRWGRARFFRVMTKDRDGFSEDLEWVVSQDLGGVEDPPHWASYIQRDAERLLGEIDRFFRPAR